MAAISVSKKQLKEIQRQKELQSITEDEEDTKEEANSDAVDVEEEDKQDIKDYLQTSKQSIIGKVAPAVEKGSKKAESIGCSQQARSIIKALGGSKNIKSVKMALETRVLVTLCNASKADQQAVEKYGVHAVWQLHTQWQLIVGDDAVGLANAINDALHKA